MPSHTDCTSAPSVEPHDACFPHLVPHPASDFTSHISGREISHTSILDRSKLVYLLQGFLSSMCRLTQPEPYLRYLREDCRPISAICLSQHRSLRDKILPWLALSPLLRLHSSLPVRVSCGRCLPPSLLFLDEQNESIAPFPPNLSFIRGLCPLLPFLSQVFPVSDTLAVKPSSEAARLCLMKKFKISRFSFFLPFSVPPTSKPFFLGIVKAWRLFLAPSLIF